MQIDYFTIFAQIVNFLILILLLRHFLYRPVIATMDAREQEVASRLKEAEQKKRVAEQEAESYRRMIQDLEERREEMLARAREEANDLRADLEKKAAMEVDSKKASWLEALESHEANLLSDLTKRVRSEVYSILRLVLKDLADEDLEHRVINAFLKRLQNMNSKERKAVMEFYETPGQQVTVRSAFEIPADMRQRIQETLKGLTGRDANVKFEVSPELVAGIEMTANSLRIAWSIDSYLEGLKVDLPSAIEQKPADETEMKREG